MEPPTPQCVGREFVRQYYTLLNQAPLHLHRFYNSSSSFVHGGIDGGTEAEEVRGQQQIHEKIVQLNFRDCHAKIRKVDSHKTLGDGVVVQVSGELSNNGQPMRRFVQTFVLAPQSPKKYYVHNDIFRYQSLLQDEVFTDAGETETTTSLSVVEEQGRLEKPIQEQIMAAAQGTKPPSSGQPMSGQMAPIQQQPEPVKPVQEPVVIQEDTYVQEPHVNGVVGYSTSPPVPEQPAMEVEEESPAAWSNEVAEAEVDGMEDMNELSEQETPVMAAASVPVQVHQQAAPAEPAAPANNGPMSYRDRVLASQAKPPPAPVTGGVAKDVSYPPQQQAKQQPSGVALQQSAAVPVAATAEGAMMNNGGAKNLRARENSRGRTSIGSGGPAAPGSGQQRPNERYGSERGDGEGGRQRMTSNAGDQYQLFVGNLPHSCTDQDLKELFKTFGPVQDVRINNKKGSRNAPGGKPGYPVPNYGFVVFEDIASVDNAMRSQPIMLNGNHRYVQREILDLWSGLL